MIGGDGFDVSGGVATGVDFSLGGNVHISNDNLFLGNQSNYNPEPLSLAPIRSNTDRSLNPPATPVRREGSKGEKIPIEGGQNLAAGEHGGRDPAIADGVPNQLMLPAEGLQQGPFAGEGQQHHPFNGQPHRQEPLRRYLQRIPIGCRRSATACSISRVRLSRSRAAKALASASSSSSRSSVVGFRRGHAGFCTLLGTGQGWREGSW